MRQSALTVLIGGVLGAAASTAAVAGLRHAQRSEDPYADVELGELDPTRTCTVAADDGVPLAVEELDPADGGEPELTVVLVHGFALSQRSWHFQREALAGLRDPRVRVVSFDHRSHGRSGRATRGTARISQLALDVAAVIRTVAPNGPLVLVGHSMGGMTLMELARVRPELFAERVRGVALLATSAGEVGAHGLQRPALSRYNPLPRGLGQFADWQPGFVELVRGAGDGITRRLARRLSFGPGEVSPSLVTFMAEMLAVTPVAALTEFLPTLGSHNRYAALAGLRHARVLVIAGEADKLLPTEHSERIAAELPDASMVRIDGAGHMLMLEHPELVNQHLIELIRACSTRRGGRRRGRRSA